MIAGVVGAVGVAAGAYTAHGFAEALEKLALPEDQVASRISTAEIAVRYHLIHAVALLALSAAPSQVSPRSRGLAAFFFLVGLACFCGVLYAKAFSALQGFNLVVPLGGLSFIVGWLMIAFAGIVARPVTTAQRE